MTPPQQHANPPELDPELKEMYEMTAIKFKIVIAGKLQEKTENTERQQGNKKVNE